MTNINTWSGELDDVCRRLAELARRLDQEDAWPGDQFRLLAETGVLGWVIPEQYGGSDISALDLTVGYERLSAACLTTAFVLTQRNGACQRIAACESEELKSELLPPLARGELFATVGISHLTTSRQHLRQPSVRVAVDGDDFIADGIVPWVTGANHADYVITGGTCDDGRQVLLALPTDLKGVAVQSPPRLLALNGSQTSSIELNRVRIARRLLLAGPVEGVMKRGAGASTGGFATSALALGATQGILSRFGTEAEQRPDLRASHSALDSEREELCGDIQNAVLSGDGPRASGWDAEAIRSRANSLVLRTAQAYLAASKGAGYVAGHPAERAIRESMFFLVWSCPQPVLSAALEEFACLLN